MVTLGGILLGALLVIGAVLALRRVASFSAQRPDDYDNTGPEIDIRRHLDGPILCEGVIYGPTGRVSSRFVADFEGQWEGDSGRLYENFVYDGTTNQSREWALKLGANGVITATAPDVIGEGRGWQCGSAVLLKYRIRLPQSSGGHVLSVTDWMYLTANGTIMNRSQFRKFGIKVAELVATMRPIEAVRADRVIDTVKSDSRARDVA